MRGRASVVGLLVLATLARADTTDEGTICDSGISRPEFDRAAVLAGLSTPEAIAAGSLIIKCHITADGVVSNCRALKGLPVLGQAVAARLHKTKVKPVTCLGKPIAMDYVFAFTFQAPSTSDGLHASAPDGGTVR